MFDQHIDTHFSHTRDDLKTPFCNVKLQILSHLQ